MLLKGELKDAPSNMNMMMMNQHPNMNDIPSFMDLHQQHEIPKAPPVNRRKRLFSLISLSLIKDLHIYNLTVMI